MTSFLFGRYNPDLGLPVKVCGNTQYVITYDILKKKLKDYEDRYTLWNHYYTQDRINKKLDGYISYQSLVKWLHNGFDTMLISAGLGMFSYYVYKKVIKVFSQSDDNNDKDLTPRKFLTNSVKKLFAVSKKGAKKYLLPTVGLVTVHRVAYHLVPYCVKRVTS